MRQFRAGVAAAICLTLAFWPPAAIAEDSPRCDGKPATIIGTPGDDQLTGTAGDDVIVALDGADTVDAGLGNDTVCAGDGDDTIYAGPGDDWVASGPGEGDYVEGDDGDDRLLDAGQRGYLAGDNGDDVLVAAGAYLQGGPGNDRLTGGDQGQYLEGDEGADTLDGGGGRDQWNRADYLDAGEGDDVLIASTEGDEYLDGGSGADRLESRGGNGDYLDGGDGDDELNGALGDQYLDGGAGRDQLEGRGGDDDLDAGPGDDALAGNAGSDAFDGGGGNDILYARDGQTDQWFDCGDGHDYVISDDPEDNDVERVRCNAPGEPGDSDVDDPGVRLDADGDALLDAWERDGFDSNGDGQIDVDLAALGARPDHKDIFVGVAWLKDEHVDLQPPVDAFREVVDAFDNAPVDNPDGSTGIALHIEFLGSVPRTASNKVLDDFDSGCNRIWTGDFDAAKQLVLSRSKRGVYHFALIAELAKNCKDGHPDRLIGGESRNNTTTADDRGDPRFAQGTSDFFVSLGTAPDPLELRVTFMHELGHNLGLGHGGVIVDAQGHSLGADHVTYEPNHLSVMNYSFSNTGLRTHTGSGPSRRDEQGKLDYSRFTSQDLPDLHEDDLDETIGLQGSPNTNRYLSVAYCPSDTGKYSQSAPFTTTQPVNWDCYIDAQGKNVKANINGSAGEVLNTVDEWKYLVYDGGAIGAGNQVAELPDVTPTTGPVAEPTLEQLEATALSTTIVADPVVRLSPPALQFSATLTVTGSGVLVGRRLEFSGHDGTAICAATTDSVGRATCESPPAPAILSALGSGGYTVRYAGESGFRAADATGAGVEPVSGQVPLQGS